MSYNDIFGDGEVYGGMVTIGIICLAFYAPTIVLAIRKCIRKMRSKE